MIRNHRPHGFQARVREDPEISDSRSARVATLSEAGDGSRCVGFEDHAAAADRPAHVGERAGASNGIAAEDDQIGGHSGREAPADGSLGEACAGFVVSEARISRQLSPAELMKSYSAVGSKSVR